MLLMFERVNRNVLSKCEEFSDNEKSNLFSHDISDKNGNGIGRETEFTFKFIFTCMKNSEKKKQPDDGKLNFVAVRKSKMYFVETSQTFVTFILVYYCRNFNSVFSTLFFSREEKYQMLISALDTEYYDKISLNYTLKSLCYLQE